MFSFLFGSKKKKPTKTQKEYSKYLATDRWKKIRDHVRKRDKKCKKCKATKWLQVHHTTYQNRGCKDWRREAKDCILLCRDCHHKEHKKKR